MTQTFNTALQSALIDVLVSKFHDESTSSPPTDLYLQCNQLEARSIAVRRRYSLLKKEDERLNALLALKSKEERKRRRERKEKNKMGGSASASGDLRAAYMLEQQLHQREFEVLRREEERKEKEERVRRKREEDAIVMELGQLAEGLEAVDREFLEIENEKREVDAKVREWVEGRVVCIAKDLVERDLEKSKVSGGRERKGSEGEGSTGGKEMERKKGGKRGGSEYEKEGEKEKKGEERDEGRQEGKKKAEETRRDSGLEMGIQEHQQQQQHEKAHVGKVGKHLTVNTGRLVVAAEIEQPRTPLFSVDLILPNDGKI